MKFFREGRSSSGSLKPPYLIIEEECLPVEELGAQLKEPTGSMRQRYRPTVESPRPKENQAEQKLEVLKASGSGVVLGNRRDERTHSVAYCFD